MKRTFFLIVLISAVFKVQSQNTDSLQIRKIFENAINNREAYHNLKFLCKQAPGRLLGTENSIKALNYMKNYAEQMGADTVFLMAFQSPAWIHESSDASIINSNGKNRELSIAALGPSASTPKDGLTAEVIEVMSLEEIEKTGREKIAGKIVFFNRPMKSTFINPFRAYGDAVDQRYWGPVKASEYGAAAVIVRSMTPNFNGFPHTGSCGMRENKIPAVAVSTMDADYLSLQLKDQPDLKLTINVQAVDTIVTTYNLVADIQGKEKPEEIILVSGHIDAWFNTEGAHDDGAGCVQAMDVLRIFKDLEINNKRTIRAVMFMDEELYQSGGNAYAAYAAENQSDHLIAMECDAGAFMPIGLTFDADREFIEKVQKFKPLLKPYGGGFLKKGYGGVDISPLKKQGVPLSGLNTVRQRYYDYHHCETDTFEEVNFRELQMGTTLLAGFVYLIDKHGDSFR